MIEAEELDYDPSKAPQRLSIKRKFSDVDLKVEEKVVLKEIVIKKKIVKKKNGLYRQPFLTYVVSPSTGYGTSSIVHFPSNVTQDDYKTYMAKFCGISIDRYDVMFIPSCNMVKQSPTGFEHGKMRLSLRKVDWLSDDIQSLCCTIDQESLNDNGLVDFAKDNVFVWNPKSTHTGSLDTCERNITMFCCFGLSFANFQEQSVSLNVAKTLFIRSRTPLCSTCNMESIFRHIGSFSPSVNIRKDKISRVDFIEQEDGSFKTKKTLLECNTSLLEKEFDVGMKKELYIIIE